MRSLWPRSPLWRGVLVVAAFALVVNLAAVVLDAVAPSPGGPPSSSFATAGEGFAAWAELAQRRRIVVGAIRELPREADLPAGGTVVALDAPEVEDEDVRALLRFAEGGGTVVAGGRHSNRWIEDLVPGRAPRHAVGGPERAGVLAPARESAGVSRVSSDGDYRWTERGAALPVVGGEGGNLVVVAPAGRGRVVLVADSSPLRNRRLAEEDNAALALSLAGKGPLVFAESLHGYGTQTGLRALPTRVKWALGLLALAGLLFLLAHGRRFGPPEAPRRALSPPRAAYVDALAATLARTREHEEAVAPVREAALDRLRTRPAAAAGLTEEEVAALQRPATSDEDVLAVGRALARLEGGKEMIRR